MSNLPRSKPQASPDRVRELARQAYDAAGIFGAGPLPRVSVLAVRGYYQDTMGEAGRNDVGIYDDAFFIVEPSGVNPFNGNTDPSRYGWNAGAGKFMARLKPGVWTYRPLKHHASRPDGYPAFGQGNIPVTVDRMSADGEIHNEETGCFGINLHRGGVNGTSSEGCLTVPQEQWEVFHYYLSLALDKAAIKSFPLILIEGAIS